MHALEDIASTRQCHPGARGLHLRAHLMHRIARRYETVTEPMRVGQLELTFTRIKEPDRVLDQIVEEEDRRERVSGKRGTVRSGWVFTSSGARVCRRRATCWTWGAGWV
jgi:hypothetical protein